MATYDQIDQAAAAEILANLASIAEQGKGRSVLLFVLSLTRKIRAGGWKGECRFLVEEFGIKGVEFTNKVDLELLKEELISRIDDAGSD